MRRPLVAGNWKMNLDRSAAGALAQSVAEQAAAMGDRLAGVDLVVCPPSVYLDVVASRLDGTAVEWGAQNMYHQPDGAFTGEISAGMLLDLGCRWVILGHSERRGVLGETDREVNQKVRAALDAGLTPIVCVGELLAEREAGRTAEVVRRQFDQSLAGLSDQQIGRLTLAYEPVWAIGTGHVATPKQAAEVHDDLRKLLAERYNGQTAEGVRILYGGSVKPENAGELLAQTNIDGALVGGASLKVDSFLAIAAAAETT